MDATRRVSIVLPVYNQAYYLSAAMDGVFAQTYGNFELIVVNDGSTDTTAAVLADYQRRHSFTVIEQKNQGLPRALNAGFAHARGHYLTWISSDNIMLPEMLAVLVDALNKDPSLGLVYADRYLMDEEGRTLGRFNTPNYDPYLLLHVNLVHCCFLYRRECMERVGGYDPQFIYGEDWEYWIRISQYYRMKRVPQALYHYRLHSNSMTSELVRGTAHNMGYAQFAARMRRRMLMRWYIGKLKWWWLRLTQKDHTAVAERTAWRRAIIQAASLVGQR